MTQTADSQPEDDPLAPTPQEGGDDPIAALEADLADAREAMLRARADAENARRRATRDRAEASAYAIAGFARDMLGVADTLARALGTAPESDPVAQGVRATAQMLDKTMARHGVERIDAMGQEFDPERHEVMFEAPAGGAPGTVVQVLEDGYVLRGRLLRPARVAIAAASATATEAGDVPPAGSEIDTQA